MIGQGGLHQQVLYAEAQEQVTLTWSQSTWGYVRNCFKLVKKGSAKKTHTYFIWKFFFIICLERSKKKEKKQRKQPQQILNKELQCFYFPKGCFLQRSTSWNCKCFGGVIQKRFVASAGSSPQIPVLFPEMSVVHIWLCVWFIKTVPGLRAGAHRPSPGSCRHSSLIRRLLSAFPGTRSHMDLTITDLNATCWWLTDLGKTKS